MVGIEVNPVVIAVKTSPKTAFPEMVTVPDNSAASVINDAAGLAGDAKCVAVSALRWVKLYEVLGVNSSKVVVVCHASVSLRYS